MSQPALGVVTIVHGRHEHLAAQATSLARGRRAEVHVVVAMEDRSIRALLPDATVVDMTADIHALPLAAARNLGAATAIAAGAERLVFLDADCLVDGQTLDGYAGVSSTREPRVWCGPVTYLPDHPRPYPLDRLDRLGDPHPGRPDPGPDRQVTDERWELFWSLSFAVDVATWDLVGGFDETYSGYGAEDTDWGQRARSAGCRLTWTGDARAYHQWHPPGLSATRRDDIVRNANLFYDRWGWWPMTTWLAELESAGMTQNVGGRWVARR